MQKTYSRGEDKKEIERKRQEGRMRQKKKEFLKSYKKNNYRLDIGSDLSLTPHPPVTIAKKTNALAAIIFYFLLILPREPHGKSMCLLNVLQNPKEKK